MTAAGRWARRSAELAHQPKVELATRYVAISGHVWSPKPPAEWSRDDLVAETVRVERGRERSATAVRLAAMTGFIAEFPVGTTRFTQADILEWRGYLPHTDTDLAIRVLVEAGEFYTEMHNWEESDPAHQYAASKLQDVLADAIYADLEVASW